MFRSTDKFEMPSDRSEAYSLDKRDGFRVKTSTAFILTFLALVIAVGVGLIVHFANGGQNVVCQCSCGDSGSSGGQGGCPEQTTPTPVTCAPCPTYPETTPGMSTPDMSSTLPQTTSLPPSTSITDDVLLPRDIIPEHYNVVLRPNLYGGNPSNFSLEGSVEITTKCEHRTRNITLHIQNLNVTNGTLNVTDKDTSSNIEIEDYWIDYSARHFLVIQLKEDLIVGREYDIEMAFAGPLQNTDLSGLYYSTYTDGDETKYMAITQFQPTDARKAFPSFDEPALKATFNITLERRPENGVITLSNMPNISQYESTDGYVGDVYNTTVVMPTYLLAFAVCDFASKFNTTKNGHMFGTYSRREYIDHTNYSLWVGSMLLDAMEDYFGIPYSLPKLDMIAIPDFSAGAMENWGLVTYRESIMFYHPNISTAGQHMFTALVVSHELAHMWFGNLISPNWWDDLWLNEGFATFFEYFGVDLVETDWKMMDFFALDCLQYSFDTDSLDTSRPIYQEVWTPNQINGIFDTITYFKGASVIRMMWFFLGADVFQRGLSDYIKSREYGNVQHDDLWNALSKESEESGTNVNVTRIMDTWVEQKNYPLVNVTIENGQINLTQQRFLLRDSNEDSSNYLWEIPITYTTNSTRNFEQDYTDIVWMNTTEHSISDSTVTDQDWIILNIQEYGYYRVNYPQNIWDGIIRQLNTNHTVIHVVNRAAIISDAWALNKAGILDINTALHTIDHLDKEKEYLPWGAAVKELSYVDRILVLKDVYGLFESFMVEKVRSTFMETMLNISQDQPVQKIFLQSSVASRACKFGIPECLDEAARVFHEWKSDPNNYIILPDIKPTVLCTSIRHGTSNDWDFLFQRYANSSANDQNIFTNALSCSKDSWILNRFLEYSLDTSKIRSQNTRSVILAVASNPIGRNLAWTFVRSNWNYLVKESGLESGTLSSLVVGLTQSFSTEYDLKQVEIWKEEHGLEGDQLSGFDRAIETIKINMAWIENNYAILKKWLEDNYSV